MMINRRRVMGNKKVDPYAQYAVDLGLPSGILWMDRNIGANAPENYGLYFAWGETTGYANAAARNTALGREDGFTQDSYQASGIKGNLDLAHDAANVALGGYWRMPTKNEIQEMISNCDLSTREVNGIAGVVFTSKINGKTIFFPNNGSYDGKRCYWYTYSVRCWSSTTNNGLCKNYNDNYAAVIYFQYYQGLCIRPVKQTTI